MVVQKALIIVLQRYLKLHMAIVRSCIELFGTDDVSRCAKDGEIADISRRKIVLSFSLKQGVPGTLSPVPRIIIANNNHVTRISVVVVESLTAVVSTQTRHALPRKRHPAITVHEAVSAMHTTRFHTIDDKCSAYTYSL